MSTVCILPVQRAALAHANKNASVIAKDNFTELIVCTHNYKVCFLLVDSCMSEKLIS